MRRRIRRLEASKQGAVAVDTSGIGPQAPTATSAREGCSRPPLKSGLHRESGVQAGPVSGAAVGGRPRSTREELLEQLRATIPDGDA
eukprot:3013844-Pyramimonas_sp.AAC.1